MKKTFIFLLLVSLLNASALRAQAIKFGVKAGVNYSNISGDVLNQDQYKSKFGVHGGLMLNIGLVNDGFLSVQPEVLFSQKGFKYADTELNVGADKYRYTGKVTYNYIDIPVLLKITTSGLYFEAGPQFGYLASISNDVAVTKNGQIVSSNQNYGNLDNAKRSEIGYAAGLGYQSESGPMIGLRYNGGLTDFAKDGYQGGNFKNARNSVFMLSVGYMLGGH